MSCRRRVARLGTSLARARLEALGARPTGRRAFSRDGIRSGAWWRTRTNLRVRCLSAAGCAFVLFPYAAGATAYQVADTDPFAVPPLRLTRVVTITSSVAGNPQLTAPKTILADSANILVLDPPASGVHRFDDSGRWLGLIGGEGDGPGEFRSPSDMGWFMDTLWVSDPAAGRMSLFNGHSGDFVRSTQFRSISDQGVTVPRRMLGSLILSVPRLASGAAADTDSVPVLLLDHDGVLRDTLAWRLTGRETASIPVEVNSPDSGWSHGTLTVRHPFDARSLFAADPRGRWLYFGTWRTGADDASYFELLQITGRADTIAITPLPFPRFPVSRHDIESYAEQVYADLPKNIRSRLSERELANQTVRQVARPARAAIDAMVAGDDQTIWLREGVGVSEEPSSRWVAYRFGQGFLGVAALPEGHELVAESGGLLWTKSWDSLGLPGVTGWKISWPGGLE